MLLRGAAGTGKTTLAAAMVRALLSLSQHIVLMAPTGRAAKVFSVYSGHPAYTIHRRIYRQQSLEGAFSLNFNSSHDTLFIVDEASMINSGDSAAGNGGGLLSDLVSFVYNGRNCRLLLIGDHAQLPPVGEQESPALQRPVLQMLGMHVYEITLNEVLRQSRQSGILYNATVIRQSLDVMPKIRLHGFADIQVVSGDELIETLAGSYSRVGIDETMVVTRSNKRANIYNRGIRNTILDREDELSSGDRLLVVKNNYFWGQESTADKKMEFIANGDLAVVQRVRNIHELYGFRFAEVTMTFPDYDDYELTATTLLDTLLADAPALTEAQQAQLSACVMEDYSDIPQKAERLKQLKADKYYNALQIKFAYAATCHKAQGGQWQHVYVDQGYMTDEMLNADYCHWLYTAFTRATEKLYLVNWPAGQTETVQ